MRLRVPVFLVLVLTLVLFAAGGARAGDPVQARVLFDSGNRIVLGYDFGDYESRVVEIGGAVYREIRFPGEPALMVRGAPALPHVNRSIVIPDDARMKLRVLDSTYHEVFAAVAPSKGTLSRTIDPAGVPYEFGAAYRTHAFYPGPLATLTEPYILRDRRGMVVRVHPFQYNPVSGVLRVYSKITLEVVADGPGTVNVLDRSGRAQRPSRALDELQASHFLNYPSTEYEPIDEEGEMLIICHDAWLANMAPFVAHKSSAGIDATVVGVSTIGNNSTSIKNYIQSVYDSSNLAFVLLVGDINEVASPNVLGGGSDPSYSKLAGNDDYPEILVGRFSASTLAQLETQIQRTIAYESQPATEQDWFWKGTGIASAEGAGIGDEGQSDKQHEDEIRDWLLGAGYTEVDQIYDPGAYAGEVSVAVNEGRGVINYTGHGWPQGWGTTGFDNNDVDALTNTGMLPFIVSVACNNGEFESYGTCFAEAWMRATHNGEPAGAVGIYASSISQYWAEPMEGQDEFNLLLTDPGEPYHSLGAMCYAGSCSMMDAYGQSGVDMFDTWNLFGDPSLRVRGTAAPHGMIVEPATIQTTTGPAGGPFAPQSFQYTLKNMNERPINYLVTSTASWLTVHDPLGSIPPLGQVTVAVSIDEATRSFDNGTHWGALEFVNLDDHDGDTLRTAGLTVGIPQRRYQWTLDMMPFWLREGRWEYGQPTGQGGDFLGFPDPTGGATGDNVFGVNLQGDYPANLTDGEYLTSSPFNLLDTFGASVRFQRWLNTEAMPHSSATIEVSIDGIDWTTVWQNGEPNADNAWFPATHSIAVADAQSHVRVRWGYGVHDADAVPCSGWNIDDVEIWAVPEGTARITLSVDRAALDWNAIQGATGYDLVRGDLETLLATGGDFVAATEACFADEVVETGLPYTAEPEPGRGWWILVRGSTADGPMTYQALYPSQVGLRDEEIAASGAACP